MILVEWETKQKTFFWLPILSSIFFSGYATLQSMGYYLLPLREKIHNFQKNALFFSNKVTFLMLDICPHDKTNIK